jgi:hypothetical protein
MSVKQKLIRELKDLGVAMLYFGCWIGALVLIKKIVLAEYDISSAGFSVVFVGALILSKVVLILEHVSLGNWVQTRPAWVDLILRSALYAFGVLVVLLLEKAFEARDEYDGFGAALRNILQHRDIDHVWANAICLTGALFSFNLLSVIKKNLGKGGILRLFLQPPPIEPVG